MIYIVIANNHCQMEKVLPYKCYNMRQSVTVGLVKKLRSGAHPVGLTLCLTRNLHLCTPIAIYYNVD